MLFERENLKDNKKWTKRDRSVNYFSYKGENSSNH